MCDLFHQVSADAIFSTITSLAIFSLGFLANKIYDMRKEAKNYSATYNFFLEIIESNIDPIKEQADAYKELAEQIKNTKRQDLKFKTVTSLDLQEYENIDRENLFKHLSKQNAEDDSDLLGQVFNAMNMLKRQRANTKENYSTFVERLQSNQEKWLNNLNSILRLHDRFIHEIKNGNSELNEFYKEIDTIVADWEKIRQDEEIEHTYKNLVEKIYECCLKYTEDSRSQEFLPLTIHAKYAHDNLVHLHKTYSDLFLKDHDQLLEQKSKIEKAMKQLKKNT